MRGQSTFSLDSQTFSNPTITGIPVGIQKLVGSSGVPVYLAATGSMGNNGALTLGTALNRTFDGGLWLYLPAAAIAAGSTAGFYWTVMSSTTVGTVFNSTYTSGFPSVGTATPFVTTGPGAFTGVTGAITAQSVTVPANSMGARGFVAIDLVAVYTNSAGTKTIATTFGGTTLDSSAATTTMSNRRFALVVGAGTTGRQIAGADVVSGIYGAINDAPVDLTVDTTQAVTVTISLNKNTATDNFGCEYLVVNSAFNT